jgi:hypothetical protein
MTTPRQRVIFCPDCDSVTTIVGDPCYPNYGTGGYEIRQYDLAVTYDPATDVLNGVASTSTWSG